MDCPKCKKDIGDFLECEHKIISAHTGYNWEFAQKEHWFYAEIKCPDCEQRFEFSDSSL